MKFKAIFFLTVFFLVFLGFTLTGCSDARQPAKALENGKDQSLAVNVKVSEIQPSSLNESLRLLGETQANIDVTFSAEVAGRLEYLAVDYGDSVKKGQILARVDFEMLSAQTQQAQAAYDLAQKTYERLETLLEDELVTQQQIDEAKASLIQAEAQLMQMQTALRHSTIKSTIDGVVARKFVEEGEYIMPGSPLLRVLDYSDIIVTAQVPENRVSELTRGQTVSIWVEALKETFKGSVDVILPNADPESRTFTTRVRTENPNGRILVGMAATLNIHIKNHLDVIVLPQDVVVEQSGNRFVFIVDEAVARKLPVTLGASEGQSVIVASGLTIGDRVIVEGQRDLVDGQPINIVN